MTASWEVRSFVAGDVDTALCPPGGGGAAPTRTTSNRWVRPRRSKRRDRHGPLESKTRIGAAEELNPGVPGVAERSVKRPVRKRDVRPLRGPLIEVRKQLWRRSDVQIRRPDFVRATWWTIAVPVNSGRTPKASRKVIAAWVDLLTAQGQASSAPMWLRARWSDEHGRLPAESQ